MNWPLVPLAELLIQHQDYIDVPQPKFYPKLSVKLYGKGVVLDTPTDGSSLRMQRHQIAKSGQVILSEIWGKKGAIGFVPPEGEGALCTSHFFLFDVCRDRVKPKWLQAIFTANYLQDQLETEAKGTTGYAAVRPKHLLAAKIPLPPLPEQRRIVARIEELAAKIEEARGLRRQTPEEAEALLDAATVATFHDSKLRPFLVRVDDADLVLNRESRDPARTDPNGEFAYVDISLVGKGSSILNSAKTLLGSQAPSRARRVIHTDNIIFSTVRPNLRAVAKVGEQLDGQICSTGFAVFTCGPSIDPDFLFYQLCSPFFIDQCVASTTGGHYPAINDTNLRQALIAVPPRSEQRRIVAYMHHLHSTVDTLKQLQAETAAELDAMLPSILDKAFKGDLS